MAELIERYVAAVGGRLPRGQRADVENELRSSLYDTLEARGGPSEDALLAVLLEMGPPEKVAASYRPQGEYLIGPELYPHFRRVVRVVPLVLAALILGAFSIGLIFSPGGAEGIGLRLLDLLWGTLQAAVTALGIIVIVFALLQHFGAAVESPESRWDPGTLPPVAPERDRVGRGESLVGVLVPALVLGLLNLFHDRIGLYVTPSAEPLLNDVLVQNLPWINTALLLGMALQAVLLVQGRWHGYTRLASFAEACFAIYVFSRVVVATAAARSRIVEAGLPDRLVDSLVGTGWAIVLVTGVVTLVGGAKHLQRALRGRSIPSMPGAKQNV